MNNVLSQLKWPLTALILVGGLYASMGKVADLAPLVNPAPAPVVPVTSLAALVPDPESRAKLAQFYADFSLVLQDHNCPIKTTGQFLEAGTLAVRLMQSAGRLTGVAAIDKPIAERLALALGGLQDRPLTDIDRANLARTMDQIALEFRGV
jgi:hypothetical protein